MKNKLKLKKTLDIKMYKSTVKTYKSAAKMEENLLEVFNADAEKKIEKELFKTFNSDSTPVNPENFKKKITKYIDKIEFSSDFDSGYIDYFSVINFIRYVKYFKEYNEVKRFLYMGIDSQKQLTLRLNSKSNYFINFIFKTNGAIDFLSLEKACAEKDRGNITPFYLRGSIDTSQDVSFSYKIKRLLASLDVCEDESSGILGAIRIELNSKLNIKKTTTISEKEGSIKVIGSIIKEQVGRSERFNE